MRAVFLPAAALIAGLVFSAAVLTPVSDVLAQSTIDKPLENPADEKRALALNKLLRCLVCQNQSISDSNAELARDLRVLVRQRIGMGSTDDEVITYLVDRYGDWVLHDPPVKATTYALWFGPAIMFVLALIGVIGFLRRNSKQKIVVPPALSAQEEARLKDLLDESDEANK